MWRFKRLEKSMQSFAENFGKSRKIKISFTLTKILCSGVSLWCLWLSEIFMIFFSTEKFSRFKQACNFQVLWFTINLEIRTMLLTRKLRFEKADLTTRRLLLHWSWVFWNFVISLVAYVRRCMAIVCLALYTKLWDRCRYKNSELCKLVFSVFSWTTKYVLSESLNSEMSQHLQTRNVIQIYKCQVMECCFFFIQIALWYKKYWHNLLISFDPSKIFHGLCKGCVKTSINYEFFRSIFGERNSVHKIACWGYGSDILKFCTIEFLRAF